MPALLPRAPPVGSAGCRATTRPRASVSPCGAESGAGAPHAGREGGRQGHVLLSGLQADGALRAAVGRSRRPWGEEPSRRGAGTPGHREARLSGRNSGYKHGSRPRLWFVGGLREGRGTRPVSGRHVRRGCPGPPLLPQEREEEPRHAPASSQCRGEPRRAAGSVPDPPSPGRTRTVSPRSPGTAGAGGVPNPSAAAREPTSRRVGPPRTRPSRGTWSASRARLFRLKL